MIRLKIIHRATQSPRPGGDGREVITPMLQLRIECMDAIGDTIVVIGGHVAAVICGERLPATKEALDRPLAGVDPPAAFRGEVI